MKKLKYVLTTLLMLSMMVFGPLVSAQEPVEVTFWHAMNGPHQEALTALVEKFNQSQDTYKVIEQNQGGYDTLQQSIMASGVSGDLPTMSQLTASTVIDYADQGLTIPLDDYLTEENGFTDELKGSIFEGFLGGVKLNDQIYGIPFSKSVRLMYVNQDILDEAGAEIPTTWEEVRALGEQLDVPAMGLENSISMEVETMAKQNDSIWISPDLQEVDLTSEQALEPVEFIKALITDGYARQAGEDGYMSGPFSNGATALYIGSSAGVPHVLPGIEENGITLTTAPVPTFGEGEPLTLFAGNDLGIYQTASEEERAGAIAFMAFLLEADNTAEWAVQTGYLPITQDGVDSEIWQQHLEENPYLQAASDSLQFGQSQVPYVGSSEVFNEIEIALENIMLNDADVKTEMENIENLIKGHLGL